MSIVDQRIVELDQAVHDLSQAWDNLDPEKGMKAINRAMGHFQEIAIALVEQGVQAGMTQRRMSDAMGVPYSSLRGAKREFGGVR